MKKSLMKKLYLSIFTLVFAVVSLGTTTFAWFTVGGEFTVAGFDTSVKSGQGIEVGVSAITAIAPSQYYVSSLPQSELKTIVGENFTFDAVTPKITNNDVEEFQKLSVDVNAHTASQSKTEAGYIAYKLYIKSEVSGTVEFKDLAISHKDKNAITAWTSGIAYKLNTEGNTAVPADSKVNYDVFAAVRLGFVNVTTTTEGSSTSTTKAMTIYEQDKVASSGSSEAGFTAGNSVGFCPDFQVKVAAGEDGTGGKDASDIIGMSYIYGSKYSLTELKAPTANTYSSTNTKKFDTSDSKLVFKTSDVYSVEVVQGVAKVVEVYVWIEGWDAECVNAILAQGIKLDYRLELKNN